MRFRAGDGLTDLVLIPLHMKADFQGTFADHRAREAGALASALDATKRTLKDHDLVLLGDTNITEHREAARKTFVDAGFEDLNAEELQTHWRGGTTDRVFVPVHQPEFTDASFEVMSDDFLKSRGWRPSDFKRALSDHFMVVATIRVQSDDD
jgi:endonuclease/exonuclease/phosphatase family metal-dependent hydrolase